MTAPNDPNDPNQPSETIIHFELPTERLARDVIPLPPTNTPGGTDLDVRTPIFEVGYVAATVDTVTVYDIGFLLTVRWYLSGKDPNLPQTRATMRPLQAILRVAGTGGGAYPTFSLDYEAGTTPPSTEDAQPKYSDTDAPTLEQALVIDGGSWLPSDNGDHQYTTRIWSWPLPPPHALTLTVDWPALGVSPTTVRIDGASIVDVAQSL
ncbi:hypothetical protein HQ332_21945 [Rhodococcus sp. BP-359]|nr:MULTISPECIES: hypothetical protein [unclassified Rhodococcus (in: high G+C Gram-positive bacteria)]MBY6564906.1 hypothetical protein [Rhodococcus sp. BP-370]MBY6578158.1 hypothetical protein [Rhodococcus sp. BP-364]MBY6587459.1 hypothetical protein [Rhodococcus sp. BP-358]MBY6591796.1 hypothetical protein [Rhodococcus sp. BP-362]MBY6597173.1 hypothetical protein [Rhodococcus sp. BP-359]